MKKYLTLNLVVCVLLFAVLSPVVHAQMNSNYKPYVMAPLPKINDWDAFARRLPQMFGGGKSKHQQIMHLIGHIISNMQMLLEKLV